MVRCLVTGGAGFIGSHIVEELINSGHTVLCIDNESAESNEKFYWNKKAKNVNIDICDYNDGLLSWFRDVDTVFHLAAEARIQPSLINPLKTIQTNVMGTANVLQASKESGVDRVIYSSTSSAYGSSDILPLREDMQTKCMTPYTVGKVAGEQLCKMYNDLFGVKTITLRYFNVYGDRQPLKGVYAPVIGIFLKQFANDELMTVVGCGNQRRDFTHVSDVVRANMECLVVGRPDAFGQVFNIGTGTNHSILSLTSYIGGHHTYIEERRGEAWSTLADTSKAKDILQWESSVNLKDWINENRFMYGEKEKVRRT